MTAAKPANATIPIWALASCDSTNVNAADLAASRRLGRISVEHILLETSIARIMVEFEAGTFIVEVGLVIATVRLDNAIRNNANGR